MPLTAAQNIADLALPILAVAFQRPAELDLVLATLVWALHVGPDNR